MLVEWNRRQAQVHAGKFSSHTNGVDHGSRSAAANHWVFSRWDEPSERRHEPPSGFPFIGDAACLLQLSAGMTIDNPTCLRSWSPVLVSDPLTEQEL
jgi:hypothetical protein